MDSFSILYRMRAGGAGWDSIPYFHPRVQKRSLHLPIRFQPIADSGATTLFLDCSYRSTAFLLQYSIQGYNNLYKIDRPEVFWWHSVEKVETWFHRMQNHLADIPRRGYRS